MGIANPSSFCCFCVCRSPPLTASSIPCVCPCSISSPTQEPCSVVCTALNCARDLGAWPLCVMAVCRFSCHLPVTHRILYLAVVGSGWEDFILSCSLFVLERKVERFLCMFLSRVSHSCGELNFFCCPPCRWALLCWMGNVFSDSLSWNLKVLFLGT